MKLFYISYGSRIAGSRDSTYIIAENAKEALEEGKKMLNTTLLGNEYLNSLGKFSVEEVEDLG